MRSPNARRQRRFTRQAPVRHAVAVEAARLLYTREYKEYYQAKREAARRNGCKVLPTNHEIHHQLLLIADATEGVERTLRLRSMREAALEVMKQLEDYSPKLIGSVWTGHIRNGSDIDINLYADDPDAVVWKLEQANLFVEMDRVRAKRDGQVTEFVHLHLHHPLGHEIELTLYPTEELHVHPTCSITGGPMARGSVRELVQLLEQTPSAEQGSSSTGGGHHELQADLLRSMTENELLSWLPELAPCATTPQNHYHHLDVLGHTMEVARNLARLREEKYGRFGELAPLLSDHLAEPGPDGWKKEALLALAGLLHDIGKPETLSFHPSGRIQFLGHELLGARKTREIAGRLALGEGAALLVERMVALHMEPVLLGSSRPRPSQLHFFLKAAGRLAPELLILSLADVLSARGPAQPGFRAEEHLIFCREMLEEYFFQGFLTHPNLPVSSIDLATEFGVEDSALTGRLLEKLTYDYVDGDFQGREDGLARAAELLETPSELW